MDQPAESLARIEVPMEARVNGVSVRAEVPARLLLADFLREQCRLTGTHLGCEEGICGACTVLLDEQPVRSCLMFAVQASGRSITTVEGLASDGILTPLQQAFWDRHALQCAFCTPGLLISATALLAEDPNPSTERIEAVVGGHVCRCTGYESIIAAIRDLAGRRTDD